MGGSSSSANNTSTTTVTKNQSNSAAFNGDMSGHVISGLENSTIQINQTDGGAVNKALEAMYQNNKEAFSFGEEAIEINEAISKAALNSNESVVKASLNMVDGLYSDAMKSNENVVNKSLGFNENVVNKSLGFNENVVNKSLGFVDSILSDALNFGREAMQTSEKATDMALGVAKNLSLNSDAGTAQEANKNMMYTAVAVAVAGAILAIKK